MSSSLRTLRMRIGLMTVMVLFLSSTSLALWERFYVQDSNVKRNIASDLRIQRAMGKQLAAVTTQLDTSMRIPEYDHQEFMITGYVTLNKHIDGEVNFEWSLPEGVTLVSGDIKGSWSDLKQGETATAVIYVTGFSKESAKHIILQASVKVGEDTLGHSSLLSSRPEDSMEYVAPEIREHVEKMHAKEFPRGRIVK